MGPGAVPRRLSISLALCFVSAAAWGNPYSARLARREAELERRRTTPGGVLPLLGIMDLWGWVPGGEIDRVLAAAAGPRSHPLVRGVGRHLSARAAFHRGKLAAAAALWRSAGFVDRWLLCGPFDGQGKTGHDRVFPVERDLARRPARSRRYPGKGGRVSWRVVRGPFAHGRIPLGSFLGRGKDAVAYLQVLVRSPRPMPAALRLGTPGAFKVFLGPRLVASRRGDRPARMDQDTVGLWLRQGVNALTIKLSLTRAGAHVFARLTRPDGGELQGLRYETRAAAGHPSPPPRAGAPGVLDLGDWLNRPRREDLALLRDRALFQTRVTPVDPASRAAEAIIGRWVDRAASVEGYLLKARSARFQHEERGALRQALRLDPNDPWVRLRLARLHARGGQTLRAIRLLDRILTGRPDFLPAGLELIDAFRTAGLYHAAAGQLDALGRRYPRVDRLVLERANLALTLGDPTLAAASFRRYLAQNWDDVSSRRHLADLAVRRGDVKTAIRALETAIRAAPHRIYLRLNRARLLAGLGETTRATAAYQEALAIDPRSVKTLEATGRMYLRTGQRPRAWRAFRRALKIRPQNAELRAYLSFLDPRRKKGIAEQYRLPTRRLIAGAAGAPAGEPARVLLDATITEVHESGLSRTLRQRVVQVLTAAGASQASRFSIQFNPDRQMVDVRIARVRKPGGETRPPLSRRERDLNEPWAGLWYDLRALVITFGGLEPGDIVEIEYVLEDIARDNMFADYYGDMFFLQEELPVDRAEVVLITPRSRRFHVRQPRSPRIRRSVALRGPHRVYRWSARRLPKITVERQMPGWSEVSDYIHVSTYRSWSEVGRWYWGLIRRQLASNHAIAETARRITRRRGDELEKIRAIHSFVAKNTRYVGLEFGIHSYKPYPASQVLARRFGDCKDKAALMVALLAEVNVAAQIVLVRTRRRGEMARWPASLAPFDHAVVYLPRHDLYLDATAEFAGARELPSQDQGVMALHVGEGGGTLKRTPVFPAGRNSTALAQRISIRADGKASLHERRTITGQAAARWREHYQAADQRRQRFEKSWNQSVGGARVVRVAMPGLGQLSRPVRVVAELEVDGLVRRDGPNRMSMLTTVEKAALVRAHGRLSSRQHPLVMPYPWRLAERLQLNPPRGWRVGSHPSDRVIDSPFGRFTRKVVRSPTQRSLEVDLELSIKTSRVVPARYAAFRRFLDQVDRALGERVFLVR